jgi:glycosyltransferase involved in cell wall biosynthesis
MPPKVSVNIPVYNGAAFLAAALDSVLAQTYKDYEIVVVNDGSSDSSDKILKRYGAGIRYHYQANQGLAATRNRLLSLSQGEYIAFLDQDDLWLPEMLEKQVALLEMDRGIGLVYADCATIDAAGGVVAGRTFSERFRPFSGQIFEQLIMHNFIPLPTVLVRRAALEQAGPFDGSLRNSEEYDVFLKIGRAHV